VTEQFWNDQEDNRSDENNIYIGDNGGNKDNEEEGDACNDVTDIFRKRALENDPQSYA
jgi:hypothetical protein